MSAGEGVVWLDTTCVCWVMGDTVMVLSVCRHVDSGPARSRSSRSTTALNPRRLAAHPVFCRGLIVHAYPSAHHVLSQSLGLAEAVPSCWTPRDEPRGMGRDRVDRSRGERDGVQVPCGGLRKLRLKT